MSLCLYGCVVIFLCDKTMNDLMDNEEGRGTYLYLLCECNFNIWWMYIELMCYRNNEKCVGIVH